MDMDIHRTDTEKRELNKLIEEQAKDKDNYKIRPQVITASGLKRKRKEASRELKVKLKTLQGKREFRYALIGFMDNIGVDRKYIAEILKVHFNTIKRCLYLKNSCKDNSSVNKQNEK